MIRLLSTGLACLGLLLSVPSSMRADDVLMFGPSLAVYIQENDLDQCDSSRDDHPHGQELRGDEDFSEDESHFADDAGHNVTIVSASEWASMTTQQFRAYDAIVIGDAGCGCDEGELLEPVNANRQVWSPAVTGHLFLHTFDNVYHYNTNSRPRGTSSAQFDAMVDLAVDGIEFAASAEGTGLYFALACRDFEADDRGLGNLEFLSELVNVEPTYNGGGDDVEILQPGHPSMTNLTDETLSDWGSSFHDYFRSYDSLLNEVSFGMEGDNRGVPDGGEEEVDEGIVILATIQPLGSSSVLPIPTAQPATLGALALLLAALGAYVLSRKS